MTDDVPPDVDRMLAKTFISATVTSIVFWSAVRYTTISNFLLLPFEVMYHVLLTSLTHFFLEPLDLTETGVVETASALGPLGPVAVVIALATVMITVGWILAKLG